MLKLFAFLRPFRVSVALVLVLALAQSIAGLYLPRLMADIVDHGIVPGNTRQIWITGGLMLLMALISTITAVAVELLFVEHRDRVRTAGAQPHLRPGRRTSPCINSISSAPHR